MPNFVTRFAPSPTGPLHLGHGFSALTAFEMAQAVNGQFLLRIEDTDIDRCRPEWESLIYEDMHWLGIQWEKPVLRQSERLEIYNDSLLDLENRGLIYPCSCSRSAIKAAQSAPQEGAQKPTTYPGTCRHRPMSDRQPGDALRLNLRRAIEEIPQLSFHETGEKYKAHYSIKTTELLSDIGDAVLGRKEIETVSYVLACVIDDAFQNITNVIRGEDMFEFTPLQVLLQSLLKLPTPTYHHHRLIRDENEKRLAKRDNARAISTYRAEGKSLKDVKEMIAL
jgi:glutamyl-Q tRNA(Asp) synthetase